MVVELSCISKTLINFYKTIWHNIPEGYQLHAWCCENSSLTLLIVCYLFAGQNPFLVAVAEFDHALELWCSELCYAADIIQVLQNLKSCFMTVIFWNSR